MLIINGVEVISGAYILDSNDEKMVSLYTDDHTVLKNQTGNVLAMNSTSNKTFTLFTPAAADIGKWFTFVNLSTGRLTIAVAGSGVKIADSTAETGSIYCDDDGYAQLTLLVASATQWVVVGGHGTWVTA